MQLLQRMGVQDGGEPRGWWSLNCLITDQRVIDGQRNLVASAGRGSEEGDLKVPLMLHDTLWASRPRHSSIIFAVS